MSVKELVFEFAKEVSFDEKGSGIKSTRDNCLIKLLKSQAKIASSLKKKSF